MLLPIKSLVFILSLLASVFAAQRPIVLLHGLANSSSSMVSVMGWIREKYPNVYINNLEIGDGYDDSLFMNLNSQTEIVCQKLATDPNLRVPGGFIFIGYSQGALIARGFIQRCNYPPVHTYISIVGPHGGTFGLPRTDNQAWYWKFLEEYIIGSEMYAPWLQALFTIPQFWRDPYDYQGFTQNSLYLADVNNVRTQKNQTYKINFSSLQKLVLIMSSHPADTIFPHETGWFGTFALNSENVLNYNETDLYRQDWIGLQTLDKAGKITFLKTPCEHGSVPDPECKIYFQQTVLPYLV